MSENQPERTLSEAESKLAAYHDGELDVTARTAFEDELAHLAQSADATEPGQLKQWAMMGELVRGALEQEAEALPGARFEQLWDEFDRTLARDARLQEAANTAPGFGERLKAWFRPAAIPLGLAAAAALAIVVVNPGPGGEPAGAPAMAEATQEAPKAAPELAPAPEAAPALPDAALAQKQVPEEEPEFFPAPSSNEADIERIEFGGRSGTISQIESSRGITTVIWVQEDEEPVDSERSL